MKSKRSRKEYSSDDETDNEKGWSIEKKDDSGTDVSSEEEVSRKSKKRKKRRVSTSDSDSDDSDVDSHKKRKHKKKKRKHSKKKRKDSSDDSDSDSEEEASSPEESDDSPVLKKKHKHKHKHSSKHSKKRRQSHSENNYSGRDDREESTEAKSSRSQRAKMKSVCLGRAPSAEQILSEEEDYSRDTRTGKTDNSYHRNDQYKARHHQPNKPHHEAQHQDTRRHHDEQRVPYKAEVSRAPEHSREPPRQYVESYKSRPDPRERQVEDRRPRERQNAPRQLYGNNEQYHNEGKRREDGGGQSGYNKYAEGNNKYSDDRRNTNHYDKKYPEADSNRYGSSSNQAYNKERGEYRDKNPRYGEKYEDLRQQEGDYRKSQYQHKDVRGGHEAGSYERKEYQSRSDPRSNNNHRLNQDRGDYKGTSGGSNNHRYDREGHSSKDIPMRETSASKPREVKPERSDRVDSRDRKPERSGVDSRDRKPERSDRVDSRDRKPRPDYRRDDREGEAEVSGGRDKMARFSDRRRSPDEEKDYEWGKKDVKQEKPQDKGEKCKPDFALSGKLAEDTNTVNGVVLKYTEPAEARKPKRRWRFYPFKGDKALPILYIHRQSCFLLGRDRKVADIPLDHPSVSKQHAALQYRLVPFTRDDGSTGKRIRPYIIDLGSANGTFVNNKKVDAQKYVELLERDVVKFGFSQREYVLLHENSREDGTDDDDVKHSGGDERSHLKMEKE